MPVRRFWLYLPVFVGVFSAAACHTRSQAAQVQAGGYEARIGVAVKLTDRVCLAIHNSKLLPAATITLLQPVGLWTPLPTSARALIVSRNAEACPGSKGDAEASNYNLEITTGTVVENRPLIALEARVPSVYAAHSFHACASADGIHLTAWDGAKPLEGHRLWKQYYYLSADLKNNCTAAETAP
jgi:hypothetical protein